MTRLRGSRDALRDAALELESGTDPAHGVDLT
jgi:hypothetical protein